MSEDLTEESRARPSMGAPVSLWVGLLLPPIVWAGQMQLNYWAVRGACARGGNQRLYIVTAVAVLSIVLSGLCAWLGARRLGEARRVEWGAVVSNSRFMFELGLLSCAIFIIAVLAQAIAAIVLHPCQL